MNNAKLSDELRYKLIKALEENPNLSQRELSSLVGVSLGKINYCLKALVDAGWIKVVNFAASKNRSGYAYFLTPKGVKEKISVTVRFLNAKQEQYELLQKEIEKLKREVADG